MENSIVYLCGANSFYVSSVNLAASNDLEERERVLQAKDKIRKMVNVESMLMVEKGLRDLLSLKVQLPNMVLNFF